MRLKEFYKFNWIKLVLFLLVVFIPLYFLIQEASCADCPPTPVFLSYLFYILYWPFWIIFWLETLIFGGNVDWIHLKDIPFVFIALMINIIYLYSVVSLIILISNKIFKRKRI